MWGGPMTNDTRSEGKCDNNEITNRYGRFCFVWNRFGGSEHTRRSLSGFHPSHSLFVSRARIIDGSRLQHPLAAMERQTGGGSIPQGHPHNKYVPDMVWTLVRVYLEVNRRTTRRREEQVRPRRQETVRGEWEKRRSDRHEGREGGWGVWVCTSQCRQADRRIGKIVA